MTKRSEIRCGWRVQRGINSITGRPAHVRVDRNGVFQYFTAGTFAALDDEAFTAIMEARAAEIRRRNGAES